MTPPNPAPTPPNRAVEPEVDALKELMVERIGIALDNGLSEAEAEAAGRKQAREILRAQTLNRGSR